MLGIQLFAPQVVSSCSGSSAVGCQKKITIEDRNSDQVVYLLTLNNGARDSQTDYYNNVNGALIHILPTATNFNTQNS